MSDLGLEDNIEDFYEFLGQKDKDGILELKGDDIKINKTKLMGALMLGDDSMLQRILTRFRVWLLKILNA